MCTGKDRRHHHAQAEPAHRFPQRVVVRQQVRERRRSRRCAPAPPAATPWWRRSSPAPGPSLRPAPRSAGTASPCPAPPRRDAEPPVRRFRPIQAGDEAHGRIGQRRRHRETASRRPRACRHPRPPAPDTAPALAGSRAATPCGWHRAAARRAPAAPARPGARPSPLRRRPRPDRQGRAPRTAPRRAPRGRCAKVEARFAARPGAPPCRGLRTLAGRAGPAGVGGARRANRRTATAADIVNAAPAKASTAAAAPIASVRSSTARPIGRALPARGPAH